MQPRSFCSESPPPHTHTLVMARRPHPAAVVVGSMLSVSCRKAGGVGFESAWESSLLILEPLARSDWDSKREDLLECYRKTYRT